MGQKHEQEGLALLEDFDARNGLSHSTTNVASHQTLLSWDKSSKVVSLGLAVMPTMAEHLGEPSIPLEA